MAYLRQLKSSGRLPAFVEIVDMVECTGKDHLKKYFNEIVKKGGEGVMLREPGSLYTQGRSTSVRKYKVSFFF